MAVRKVVAIYRSAMPDVCRIGGRFLPWLVAFALYAVAAVVGTWPLVLRISTHLPLGTLSSATVPFFNLWTLEWNAHSLARGYSGYWNAPIFHPTPGAFALSEAQALTGLGYAALTAAVSGVSAYNLVLLIALVANALAARRLFRVLGASDAVATATGLLALGLPFVWKELGVLQLTMLWPVWLTLGELAILSGASGVLEGEGRAPTGSSGSDTEAGGAPTGASGSKTDASGSLTGSSGLMTEAPPAPSGSMPRATKGSVNVGVNGSDAGRALRRRGAALVRLSLWCAALVWTCTYYALFSSVFLLLAAAVFARREYFRPPLRGATLLALLLLLAAAYPLLAQQRIVGTYSRSTKTIHDGGATARAYTRLPRTALGSNILPPLAAKTDRRSLYPGSVLLVCAAIGSWSRTARAHRDRAPLPPSENSPPPTCSRARRAWLAIRRALSRPRGATRFFLWCGSCAIAALILSFGARWSIASFRPYEVIVERHWPGFGNARSPYRFAAFVHVFALVFAGIGFDALRRAHWRGRMPGRWRDALLLAVAAVGCLEAMTIPARLQRFPDEALREGWVEYLAQHPGGAVAMVPPALSGKAEAFEPTTVAMLQALHHGHPLLNGYSGFFPRIADAYIDALEQFPNPRSKRLLVRAPVSYVVVDKAWLGPRSEAQLAPLTRVFDSPSYAIYLVPERAP